eukprot:gnl/TRDRNA2_/TRDRNA2_176725_c1_seq1.p1 gnl/TRDRNA2_/TRDRNA2_176725_c1~~gnl/TRDRNA2_/TRDRNA2_176725_c1_seq1.p1  ORF type:complete len:216 (-),score=25.38 gnl/TRDRNA2_/TRDRNA2_176725_c1_seq1:108-755(-)
MSTLPTGVARANRLATQNIANTAWSCSTLGWRDGPLLAALAALSIPRIAEFSSQDISNTAWAYARLLWQHTPMLEALAAAAVHSLYTEECKPLHVSNIAWSFSTLVVRDAPLCEAIAASSRELGGEQRRQLPAAAGVNLARRSGTGHLTSAAAATLSEAASEREAAEAAAWQDMRPDLARPSAPASRHRSAAAAWWDGWSRYGWGWEADGWWSER